jgi:NTP pyrophosphatase (non-canonical NTP hydrolase)
MSYVEKAMRTDNTYSPELIERMTQLPFMRLLHCAMGLTTEVGELMDILKRHLFYGTDIDYVHIREEFGDLEWYKALGYDVLVNELEIEGLDRSTIQKDIQNMNISKLKKRYPEKFTEHHAVNRDLTSERKTLDDHTS